MQKFILLVIFIPAFSWASNSSVAEIFCNNLEGQRVVTAKVRVSYDAKVSEIGSAKPFLIGLTFENVGSTIGDRKTSTDKKIVNPKILSSALEEVKNSDAYAFTVVIEEPVKIYNGGNWTFAFEDFYFSANDYLNFGAAEHEEDGGLLFATFDTGSDRTKLLCNFSL
jgi:hypothetical protein